jgi:hypothetical protein
MHSNLPQARIEHDALSKLPILLPGDISPEVMCTFKIKCLGYFDNKEVSKDKYVRKILSCFQDPCIIDWITVERECLLELSFEDFMKEFRAAYLHKNWEDKTHRDILSMKQGNLPFWTFATHLQTKNALLCNTSSHLDDSKNVATDQSEHGRTACKQVCHEEGDQSD